MTTVQKEIPAGWKLVKLGELMTSVQSGFASGKREAEGVIQLRMNNVNTTGGFDWSKTLRVPRDATNLPKYHLEAGDVLFNNTNSPDLVGKSAVFERQDEPIVFSNHFTRLRPDRNRLMPDYLAAWLNQQWNNGVFKMMCNQWVNQAAVPRKALLDISIPIPPIEEQKRIAGILNKAEEIKKLREEADKKTEELIPAIFHEMVGSRINNGQGSPTGWQWVKLGDVCERVSVGHVGQTSEYYVEDGIPFLRTQNIKPGRVDIKSAIHVTKEFHDRLKKSQLAGGDLVMARVGVNFGVCGMIPYEVGEMNCANMLFARPIREKLYSTYAMNFINTPQCQRKIRSSTVGAAQKVYNTKSFDQLSILLPPLEEQKRIAEQCDSAERIKKTNSESERKIKELKSSLLQMAFRGEL